MIKKLSLGLAVLLSGLSLNALADQSPCSVSVPCYNGGVTIGLAGLYLKPSSDRLDYAITYPGLADVVAGDVQTVTPDYDWGYRVSLGYIFPGTARDVTVTYSNFNHKTKDSVIVEDPAFLVSTVTPLITADVLSTRSDASAKFNYQTLDVDFGQYFNIGCNTRVKLIAGVRFADLDSKFKARYDSVLPDDEIFDSTAILTAQKNTFKGVGPRAGVNLEYGFGNGFGVVAQTTTALLVGNNTNNFFQRDVSFVDDVAVTDETASFHQNKQTRVVPNLTGKLGVNYNYEFCNPSRTHLTVEAGYQVDHYFNIADRLNGAQALGLDGRSATDTSFNGPYVGLQIKA